MVILALLPILFLIVALKMAGWKACPIAAIIAFVVAVFCYNMSVPIAISAALEGVALACWPILLVIIMALFAYKLTVATGSLDVIKQMLTTVSEDKRVLFLLIAWGFGTFMEGMAGFGTAVAIPAAGCPRLSAYQDHRCLLDFQRCSTVFRVHRYPDDDYGCCHRFGFRRLGYESFDRILHS